ncbi:dihydroxyacetone kinase subunit DhaK [Krasilnikovia cinnamomea]|uniref:dihydroxyacetone kinase subunit DhaK n=1 Tax=Krasilnikovia cinnamomea TaxID=349313 RepID=UPI0024154985|nr:dihydroxyacetone kinase subunit DhaK [Krasilnikovia cinnamomea]
MGWSGPLRPVSPGEEPVRGKVGLISVGGSGHEPLHAGFVGPGLPPRVCGGERGS